ncbi:DUF2487 domain-containing protein [Cohnella caldifontis]|uniref:DUF2487 domain-containing protein n=1 Tax=Cohnella caldifontis TaxID=3027471 RepID=UPI0023ED0DA9|nr:DUF2487 domain-containing protein [Cohnella sp. YIM B05605]
MKFSELTEASWPDLQPYMDTCLLPVTGLAGFEAPWEMAERAADTGDWLLPLEKAFKGRTVTLPALHYDAASDKLKELCGRCRTAGFRYVILVCGKPGFVGDDAGADLVVQPSREGEEPDPDALFKAVSELWKRPAASAGDAP